MNNLDFRYMMTDVSRAFTQSDHYHPQDQLIAILPKCIRALDSSWKGEIYLDSLRSSFENRDGQIAPTKGPTENTTGVLLYRPLYGTRDAPMGWYCKISKLLVVRKFYPMRSDFCIFLRHRALKPTEKGLTADTKVAISSMVMLHASCR